MKTIITISHTLFWASISFTFLYLIDKVVTDYIATKKIDKAFIKVIKFYLAKT